MTIQEYFGTLQQSFVEVWKNHLETSKYSDHKALNDYYDDIVDAMDQTIEDYQGIYGKLGNLKNTIETEIDDPIEYLKKLKKFLKDGRKELIKEDDTEIWSDLDNVLSIIDSTLYKLKELSENIVEYNSLRNYLNESLNESVVGVVALSTAIALMCGVTANEIQTKMERGYFPILSKIRKWWGDNRAAKIIEKLKADPEVKEFLSQPKSYQRSGWRDLLKSKLTERECKYLARVTKDKVRADIEW